MYSEQAELARVYSERARASPSMSESELGLWTIHTRQRLMNSWIASDKSTRIPISTFQTALELHDVESDAEEVECMLANMVFRVSRTSSSSCSKGRLDYHA